MSAYRETKLHGTHGFPYIVYLGIIILGGVFNIPLSTGTIKIIVSRCAEKVKPALEL